MVHAYFMDNWFFGYGVLLELVFGIITLLVSLVSFRIYRLSYQERSRLFGISFLFIAISYFFKSLINYLIFSELNQSICNVINLENVALLNSIGIHAYITFYVTGLVVLAYMTLKQRDSKILFMLWALVMFALIFNINRLYLFYIISSFLMIIIMLHYMKNYNLKKKANKLLVLIAFLVLLFGNILFIFSASHPIYYILGHALELIAYILILTNLVLVLKR